MNIDLLNDLLNELLACACDTLENGLCENGEVGDCPCPCRLHISAGPPVWDMEACCGDGSLTVYSERIYPVGNFPSQASGVNLCQTPLATDVKVVLLRCFPSVRDDGSAPTGPEIDAASASIYRDQYLLTKGLLCCLAAKGRRQLYVFQGSRILPPQGGCIGVEISFVVQLISLP